MTDQVWWYTARAGGIVAWALMAAGVLWGLALSTKVLRGKPRPNWVLDLHRFLGGLAVVFTGVHVTAIVADSYVHFGLTEILVPFTGDWHPVAVAWGIIGAYFLAAVEITSLLRRRLSKRAWRSTHYLSFPLFVLTTVHALSAGTDRHSFVLRWGVIATCVAVTALTFVRVRRVERPPTARPAPPIDWSPPRVLVGTGAKESS
ncbi:MAG TPA: ferric reductase-like transmembrane domain-containing protein [Acidimicrobiales bacterium]|nr:ferric reductase-like transmembrane domain-containing protein [Acidimicrobiales bacterium]